MEKESILNKKDSERIISMNTKNLKQLRKDSFILNPDDSELKEINFLKGFDSLDILQKLYDDVPKAFMLSQKEKISKVNPKFGEIWSVDLSFGVGCEMGKPRPCVIFSKRRGNSVTIIPMTTNENPQFETHAIIDDDFFVDIKKETVGAVKCEALRSVSVARLGERLGRLSNKGLKSIVKALLHQLNLYFLLKIDDLEDDDIEDFNKFEFADDFVKDLNSKWTDCN